MTTLLLPFFCMSFIVCYKMDIHKSTQNERQSHAHRDTQFQYNVDGIHSNDIIDLSDCVLCFDVFVLAQFIAIYTNVRMYMSDEKYETNKSHRFGCVCQMHTDNARLCIVLIGFSYWRTKSQHQNRECVSYACGLHFSQSHKLR